MTAADDPGTEPAKPKFINDTRLGGLSEGSPYRDVGLSSEVVWLADGRVLVDGVEVPEMEGWLP